jgi:protein TonB
MVGTLGLFYVMQSLVAQDMGDIFDVPERRPLVIYDQLTPEPPKLKEWDVEKPKPVDLPEPDAKPETGIIDGGLTSIPLVPTKPITLDPTIEFGGLADGAAVPLVRVSPQYPQSAASRGIEGWVIVKFNVDEYGSVVDPEIIEAEPKGVFNRSALKAIKKFKYKPKVVDGIARPLNGVQTRLTYTLDDK